MSVFTLNDMLYDESQRIQKILPENVWVEVFNKLEISPDDLQNVCNATHHFRQLLFSKRKRFLGGKTVDTVVAWMKPKYGENKSIPVFNKIEKFKVKCILECRTVCLSWCNGLDQQYSKHKSQLYLHQDDRWSTATQFLQHFHSTHFAISDFSRRRPFVLEHLNIFLSIEDFHAELPDLFNVIGLRITTLGIRARINSFPNLRSCYENLGNLLLKTPNLVNLALTDYLKNDDSLSNGMSDDWNARGLFKFKKLTHLTTVGVPETIFNRIIQTNTNIRNMKLSYQNVSTESFANPLPLLSNLMLNQSNMSSLRQCAAQLSESPIRTVTVDLKFCDNFSIKWSSVFNMFPRQWSPTVHVLDLSLPKCGPSYFVEQVFQDSLNYRLKLPLVKKLKLSMPHVACLDFLLPLSKSLEYLKISDTRSFGSNELDDKIRKRMMSRQVVEYVGFKNRMYESNIWVYFPKLTKIVRDCHGIYYRKVWESKHSYSM